MSELVQLRTAAADASRGPLDRIAQGEQPLDYCLLPYAADGAAAGKLASLAILRESFALAGVEDEGMALIALLRQGLGPRRTVWGIKQHPDGSRSWELYFYDRASGGPPLTVDHVARVLGPALQLDAELDRPVDWLMFSVEFGVAELRSRMGRGVTLYVKGEDLAYELRGRTLTMGNLYRFFDPSSEIRKILGSLEQCVHYDPRGADLGRILPPRLFRAHHVCVARKRNADGMYFSRVSLPALRWFLETMGWPAALRGFVARHAAEIDYLRFDVGYDFQLAGGVLSFPKSGFYGYF